MSLPICRHAMRHLLTAALLSGLGACAHTETPTTLSQAAWLGKEAGVALAALGAPTRGAPPAVTGTRLIWENTDLAIAPDGSWFAANNPASSTLHPVWYRCQITVKTDGQFVIIQALAQFCQARPN